MMVLGIATSAAIPVASGILAAAALLLLISGSAASRLFNGLGRSVSFAAALPRSFPAAAGAAMILAAFLLERDVMSALSGPGEAPRGCLPFAASAFILALSSFLYSSEVDREGRAASAKGGARQRGGGAETRVEAVLAASAAAAILAASMSWADRVDTGGLGRMMQCSFWLAAGGLLGAAFSSLRVRTGWRKVG
jgi:hypothetical protein